ncbi:amidohydrolase family protein [Paenibacillus sp. YIM B09110]|uniref:amidohydrolase family protein n=1 Tax=Paenibacillus sp. YIM B09110 TaxID=3126102 RepID=UPI00301DB735
MNKWVRMTVLLVGVTLVGGCSNGVWPVKETLTETIVEPATDYKPDKGAADMVRSLRERKDPNANLSDVYRDLIMIDVHNHDAAHPDPVSLWGRLGIDRIVLFGDVSEPSAQITDKAAWEHYRRDTSHLYPSFAGFPIYEEEGTRIVKANLEQGYLNIGEVVAASTASPIVSQVKWKANHPNDGFFPQIYDLAADYKTPILLHIDPPNGMPIEYLVRALKEHPDTIFIFAHANVFKPPSHIEGLIQEFPNLYIDFYPGFTAYDPSSTNKLEDFVPLIERYPERFFLSTDSGYSIGKEKAAAAMFQMIDLLTPETAVKVAYQNYESIIERQPPTETQIAKIKELTARLVEPKRYSLNKRKANELIFELEQRVLEKS